MGKRIKILIGVSLLLNVLLIGVVIGILSHRLFRDDFPRRHPLDFAGKLPADKEELFLETMEKVHLDTREVRRQIDETRDKVLAILGAPDFDEASYQVETAKMDRLHGLIMQRFAEAAKELAKQFTREERKIFAEFLRQAPPPPPGRLGPSPKAGPPPRPGGSPLPRLP